jgi:hypothetical protein
LRRAVPSFTVEVRRRPRLATTSNSDAQLSETKSPQAGFDRESHRVAAAAFEATASTSPANVAAQATGRILQCLVPDEPPRGQPREVMLSISSSDLTSVPQSRRRARASGGGDQTKKLPRNSESSPIDIRALQETRSTASHRSSAEPTGEMTGVTLSGSTVASNQVFESSGGRALIPNAKGRRETQVSLDGRADP